VAGGQPQQRPLADPEEREDTRARLLAAVAKAAGEQGYHEVTVERVSRYAGVSDVDFFQHFESREQALMAAYDSFLEGLWVEATTACEATAPWPARVRGAVGAILASLVEASSMARAFVVEASSASIAGAERQIAAMDRFAGLLREGRVANRRAQQLPEATERTLVGGIASIVSGCLLAEEPQALPALEPQLVELLLMPYLGPAEAKRIAAG
jgi:AcrR family transcriptional regulator